MAKLPAWKDRLPLDRFGLCALGASLQACARASGDIEQCSRVAEMLEDLGIDANARARGVQLAVQDVRLTWHHLYHHRVLVPFLRPGIPHNLRMIYDGAAPIAAMWVHDSAARALFTIFLGEYVREASGIDLDEAMRLSIPESEEETLFYLSVADICAPPPRGRPPGLSNGMEAAVATARHFMTVEGLGPYQAAARAADEIGIEQKGSEPISVDSNKVAAADRTRAIKSIMAHL